VLATTLTVLLILGALGSALTIYLYWRAAHSADVRRVVVALRETLTTVVATGGLDAPEFLQQDRQRAEQELVDLVGRVNDDQLRRGCQDVLDGYQRVWASAPPKPSQRDSVFDEASGKLSDSPSQVEEDRRRAKQRDRQVEDARATLGAIKGVLDRVNALERFLPRRG
jgi:hypothetical protein